ncbi:Trihelix transcription factor DF1 [Linum perenne]
MEVSPLPESSGGGGGGGASEEDGMRLGEGEGSEQYHTVGGGNRWPPQETLALLKIRSDMDASFKDSGLRAPLWEEISRRMSELGYARSAKKCKEKFDNTQKYHKRTKEGRSRKSNGKSYKFFEQLEAIDGCRSSRFQFLATYAANQKSSSVIDATPCSVYSPSMQFFDNSSTSTTSTPSRDESEGTRRKKKKRRKLSEFFDGLMAKVIEKQESLQRKFVEAVERFERDRMAREEAWKLQELERIKRERELLAREREIVAAKDAAVLSFLQKFSNETEPFTFPSPSPLPLPVQVSIPEKQKLPIPKLKTTTERFIPIRSSSRWPKEEIEALIKLRTNFEIRYQEHGPKGPLWEEVSAEMKKLGYDRNPKRCKEKWENMNKYFKRVKESSSTKVRTEDSKTCPYFHQLDALYSGKRRKVESSVNSGNELKPEELLMHMMRRQEDPESATTDDGGGGNLDGESDGYRNDRSSLPAMDESLPKTDDDRRGSYFCPG